MYQSHHYTSHSKLINRSQIFSGQCLYLLNDNQIQGIGASSTKQLISIIVFSGESDWSLATRSFYGSFARIGWALAVAWVVLACTFNWAGKHNNIFIDIGIDMTLS